jgi:hypothetical protein
MTKNSIILAITSNLGAIIAFYVSAAALDCVVTDLCVK